MLDKVYLHAGDKPKYPVCFLTNGGGVTEKQKAQQLSSWLDVAIGVDQVSMLCDMKLPTIPPLSLSVVSCIHAAQGSWCRL